MGVGSRQQDVDLEFAISMRTSSSVSGANLSMELMNRYWYHYHQGQHTDQADLGRHFVQNVTRLRDEPHLALSNLSHKAPPQVIFKR